jgi:hypothetical protein
MMIIIKSAAAPGKWCCSHLLSSCTFRFVIFIILHNPEIQAFLLMKNREGNVGFSWVPVDYTCNPSYSRGRDQEDLDRIQLSGFKFSLRHRLSK